jgi:NAD(P)-dependent dehydrogenase (short-subunit alcohol dehydrogenase family)
MNELFSLKGKVAVVTGALGLIGRNHCMALSEAGASVVVADTNEQKCADFAHEYLEDSMGVHLDVTRKDSIIELTKMVLQRFHKIDILVNNAAINDMFEDPKAATEQSKFENYPLELWQKSLDVNLTGVFLCSQIIGNQMVKQEKGSIINIASTYGMTAPDQSLYKDQDGNQSFYKPPAYTVTKGGVIMFTKFLAAYWGDKGVRVNTLTPGGVENAQTDFFVENYSRKTPLGRMANQTDYQGAIVFLASDASSYMTGANLVVDGGWTCL